MFLCSQLAGALMVITLKIISCVINYNDGILKEDDLREAQKKNRLLKMPSLMEFFGYCLCCGSHFAGPVYEMKDYIEWTERKGVLYFYLYVNFLTVMSNIQILIKFQFQLHRSGNLRTRDGPPLLIWQLSGLFCSLLSAWACICILYHISHFHDSQNQCTKNMGSSRS